MRFVHRTYVRSTNQNAGPSGIFCSSHLIRIRIADAREWFMIRIVSVVVMSVVFRLEVTCSIGTAFRTCFFF